MTLRFFYSYFMCCEFVSWKLIIYMFPIAHQDLENHVKVKSLKPHDLKVKIYCQMQIHYSLCIEARIWAKKKIILLFPEMGVTRKIFTQAAAIFFNRFSGYILFSSLGSFVFLFICCFLKLKMYVLIHIRLCRQVSDKNFFTRQIFGNKTTIYAFGKQTISLQIF